jgi:hypothetical protein
MWSQSWKKTIMKKKKDQPKSAPKSRTSNLYIYKFTKWVCPWVIACFDYIFYGRTGAVYNWPPANIFYVRTSSDGCTDGWTDKQTNELIFFKKEQRSEPLLPLVFCFALGYQEAPIHHLLSYLPTYLLTYPPIISIFLYLLTHLSS